MAPLNPPRIGRLASYSLSGVFLLAAAFHAAAQIRAVPVDPPSVARGAQVFAQSCSSCHAPDARGTQRGPDLTRSLPVLHDRAQQLRGRELAALLDKPPAHGFSLTSDQLADLSQFLSATVNKILRSGYSNQPSDMLSGNAQLGEQYFRGAGGCAQCHSTTGDLAGIASRYDLPALQQRIVFPNTGNFGRGRGGPVALKPQVTVTPPGGSPVSGTLLRIDDFNLSLLDASGARRSFTRVPGTKVVVTDPYAAHAALLGKYTDVDIHNLTAFLETLQ